MMNFNRLLAGTALGILVGAAPAFAVYGPVAKPAGPRPAAAGTIILAQQNGEAPPPEEAVPLIEEAAPPQEQPAAVEEQAQPEPQAAEQAAEQEEVAPPPAEEAAPAEPEQKPGKRPKKQAAEQEEVAPPAAAEEAAPAPVEEAAPAEPEQKPRKRPKKQAAEPEEAVPPAPAEEAAPAPVEEAAPAMQEEAAPAPVEEAAPAEPEQKPRKRPKKQAAEQEKVAPVEQPPAEAAPAQQEAQPPADATAPTGEQPAPAEAQQPPAEPAPAQTEAPNDGAEAPLFDSAKEQRPPRRDQNQQQDGQPAQPDQAAQPEPAVPSGPPPASDEAAQQAAQPAEIRPVTEEQGKRREDRRDPDEPRRRERPEGSEVLREIGDRLIIEFNNQVIVESNDRPRMSRGAREVYYEDLPRGRTRETIVRPDGSQVITVRNRYGDIIRRSRITEDGREYVLVYVEEDNYDRVREWRDPGLDLPPMRVNIPRDEYIFDGERGSDPEAYYEFLEKPPVERVERLYSVDEVKRSARIRDKTRRVDLDTLTFEFGSASIAEDQVARLQSVAEAMEKLLARNPAETFLIEGHTDAVGSDLANLALSDRRAEAVADALTNVFAIPPENLATQGYGEQYLKVRTQAPERENRRVAIRRITPLVAPVAQAK
ncbi:MAG: OmpA family protein [Rhizobiaceae bacterium]|nr:OmpA family protein [Rhizobiaceae bacterium]